MVALFSFPFVCSSFLEYGLVSLHKAHVSSSAVATPRKCKRNRPFPPDFMYTTLCVNYGFDMQFSKFYGSFFPLKGTFFVFLPLSSARKRTADRFQ